jgi:hypothetical protein
VNSREAKEILMVVRPGTADEHEPDVMEALALVRSGAEPELGHWYEEHRAMQLALRDKFRQLRVPDGLKQQILSERKAYFSLPFRRRLVLASAVLVLLLGATWAVKLAIGHSPPDRFADYRARMAGMIQRQYPKMDLETDDLGQIRQFLTKHQSHGDFVNTEGLSKTANTGCALLTWHDHPVTMVCFTSGRKPVTSDVFLLVIDKSGLKDAPTKPEFSQMRKLATLSWSAGDKTYVLAGLGNEDFLKQYY